MSTMGGGKFGHGFARAAGTQLSSVMIDQIGNGAASYKAHRIMAAAVVGGTIAEVTGGKFANGGLAGAFSRAFNHELHDGEESGRDDARGMVFHKDDLNYHFHRFEAELCRVDSVCTIQSASLANRLHPAPGTFRNTQPIVDGQYGVAELGYPIEADNFGPIVHSVSSDGLTIRNTTVIGHLLHPGYVERSVFERNGSIYMRTTGEGTGNLGWLNNALSTTMWNGIVNGHIRYRISKEYGE